MEPSDHIKDMVAIGIAGICRGGVAESLAYPLDVIKTHQQNAPGPMSVRRVARQIATQEGLAGFYRGFVPQMIKMASKQVWNWNCIVHLQRGLNSHPLTTRIHPLGRQLILASVLSVLSPALTAPLDRLKNYSVQSGETMFQTLRRIGAGQFLANGWIGYATLFKRQLTGWSAFFVSQQLFRDEYARYFDKKRLNILDLSLIGIAISGTVSCATNYFDVQNTRVQSQKFSAKECVGLTGRTAVKGAFSRGLLMAFLGMSVQNICSVILIDRMDEITGKIKSGF